MSRVSENGRKRQEFEARIRDRVIEWWTDESPQPSLAHIAERTGAGERTVRRYLDPEDGTKKIPAWWVAELCRAFGVSPEWMFLNRGPRVAIGSEVTGLACETITRLLREVRDPTHRPAVVSSLLEEILDTLDSLDVEE